jgi:hypothetical protein
MGFRSLAPTERESATPVRRPGAVIVTHHGLGLAVAECDEVGGHRGFPFDRGGVSIRHTEPCGGALLIFHFWSLRSATKQGSKRALRPGTPPMLGRPHKCHGVGDLAPRRAASRPAHPGGVATPVGSSQAGLGPDRVGISGRRQRVRPRTQPTMSMIQKVSMGVSKRAATTSQYCASESFSIDAPREGYVDQTPMKK